MRSLKQVRNSQESDWNWMKNEQQKLGGKLLISFLENTGDYKQLEQWLGKDNVDLLEEVSFHMIPDTSSLLVLEQRLPNFVVNTEFLQWLINVN